VRSAGRCNLFYASFQNQARKRVDVNHGRISWANPQKLRFAIVRLNPELLFDQRHDLRARTYQLPGSDVSLSHNSVLGCDNPRVAEVRPRQFETRLAPLQIRLKRLLLSVEHGALPPLRFQLRACAIQMCPRALEVSLVAGELGGC